MKKVQIILAVAIVAISFFSCKKEVVVNSPVSAPTENSNVAEDVNVNNLTDNLKDLPANSISFIQENFSDSNVASYEIKNVPVIGKSYEVKMNNGVEIDFDSEGNWHEIQDARGVNANLLPISIKNYVDQNYKGTFVTSIEKDKNKIKVDLANDVDLEFDVNGNFVRVDK